MPEYCRSCTQGCRSSQAPSRFVFCRQPQQEAVRQAKVAGVAQSCKAWPSARAARPLAVGSLPVVRGTTRNTRNHLQSAHVRFGRAALKVQFKASSRRPRRTARPANCGYSSAVLFPPAPQCLARSNRQAPRKLSGARGPAGYRSAKVWSVLAPATTPAKSSF